MIFETRPLATVLINNAGPSARVPVPVPKPLSWKYISLILLAVLIVNSAIVLVGLREATRPLALTYSMGFGDLYDLIAKNLDEGNGYRVDAAMGNTMLREPGYPLLLAVAFKLGGYGIQQARVVCVLLAFGAALLLLQLTRKITGDTMTAVTAAVLFLLYPGILVAEARAGIEVPSVFTVVLFMIALHGAMERESLWRYAVAGLVLGAAVLVRSEVLLFPLLLLAYLLLVARGLAERGKAVARVAVLVLAVVVVLSPWITRNYLLVHQLVPTATVAGVAAQEGLYTCESTASDEPFYLGQTRAGFEREELATEIGRPFIGPYYQLFYKPQDEVAFNNALLRHVSTEYRSHPELLVRCAAKNLFFNFWFLGKRHQSTLMNVFVQAPLIGLALAGMATLWRRGLLRNAGAVLLYILYIPLVHALIIAHARHSMLIVPFLATLAAAALVSAWRGLRTQDPGFPSHQTIAASTTSRPSAADHLPPITHDRSLS
jgi:4-amino-4-deoxy-L-arabinose transferase-like glycosyltransferase